VGALGPPPRCDDELYNLLPFLNNGDTTIKVDTKNQSNDDNIFFAALNVQSSAAIVGAGIVLGPADATNPINTNHTLTATVQDAQGHPVAGALVTFTATAGPNAGLTGTGTTDVNGHATFTYSSSATGTDTWSASFTDVTGATHTSNDAHKTWTSNNGDGTPPICALSLTVPGPPKSIQVTVQDSGSGLNTVAVTDTTNANTVVAPFSSGDTGAVLVTSTKIDQSNASHLALTVTDVAGNVTKCDPIVPGLARHGSLRGPVTRTFLNVLASQSKVSIFNSSPGLRSFTILANGKSFTVKVAAGQSRKINIASAMLRGYKNTVRVRANGSKASTAMIQISS
jgi:Bacterial Ig-like domain (group 1).